MESTLAQYPEILDPEILTAVVGKVQIEPGLLIYPAVGLLIALWIYAIWQREKKRTAALKNLAAELHLQFFPTGDASLVEFDDSVAVSCPEPAGLELPESHPNSITADRTNIDNVNRCFSIGFLSLHIRNSRVGQPPGRGPHQQGLEQVVSTTTETTQGPSYFHPLITKRTVPHRIGLGRHRLLSSTLDNLLNRHILLFG